MKIPVLILTTLLSSLEIYAQSTTDQIAQNGGFENGVGYPTAHDQLVGFCPHWARGAEETPDWFTTQSLPGALSGPCNFERGSNDDVFNAQPKLATHDNSLFYGGFGSTENMRNELSRSTYPNSLVKVSFWFSPRGVTRDTRIGVIMVDTENDQHNFVPVYVDCDVTDPNTIYQPCQWYYAESAWIPTGPYTFELVQFGGMAPPNFAGNFNERGYIYIDDVNVYNGLDCCPPEMRYENTDNLSSETNVRDLIVAGYDAGIPQMSGDVTVRWGQSVSFQAGDFITLNPGFSVEAGASFNATIEDCTPFTEPDGVSIVVQTLSNVMTPNGDGINDFLCFNVSGAWFYHIKIYSRWGTNNQTLVHEESGPSTTNLICTWDGGTSAEGTYYYIIRFSNCDQSRTEEGFFELLRGGGRMMNPENDSLPFDDSIAVYPNPGDGVVNIGFSAPPDEPFQIEVYNNLGELIRTEQFSAKSTVITLDLSDHGPGMFILRVVQGDIIRSKRIIIY